MKNKKIFLFISIFSLFFILASCSSKNSLVTPESNQTMNSSTGYPIQDAYPFNTSIPQASTAYPPINQINEAVSYPINTPTRNPRSGPKFEINEPVLAGSFQVSGTGPANLPIILIDVTEMGFVISETVIGSDGIFRFELDEPLIKSHAVGIQIGDLSKTDFNYDDYTFGEDYMDRPLIGIIFDLASVVEK